MKKVLFVFCFFLLSLVSCYRFSSSVLEPSSMSSLVRETAIVLGSHNNYQPSCAGVFISPDEIITANHCVIELFPVEISSSSGETAIFLIRSNESPVGREIRVVNYAQYWDDPDYNTYTIFNVVAADEVRDLALLRTEEVGYSHFPYATIRRGEFPPLGEPVVAIGHPDAQPYTITTGIISSRPVRTPDDVILIRPSSPIFFGNSGGPLFDGNCRLLGIAHTMRREVTHLGQFISYLDVIEFLEENPR